MMLVESLQDGMQLFSVSTVAELKSLTTLSAELPHKQVPTSMEDKDSAACHVKTIDANYATMNIQQSHKVTAAKG